MHLGILNNKQDSRQSDPGRGGRPLGAWCRAFAIIGPYSSSSHGSSTLPNKRISLPYLTPPPGSGSGRKKRKKGTRLSACNPIGRAKCESEEKRNDLPILAPSLGI